MPAANVDATVILLDVGRNVAVNDKTGASFFKNARACVSRIIERKIMSRPDDLLCVVLLGSKRTNNSLAERTHDFRHIEYLTTKRNDDDKDIVAVDRPTWDLLSKLPQKPSKYEADWFEGLIVAADIFKNWLYGSKVTNKKVVLMTNFAAPTNIGDNFDQVVAGFQSEGFEVNVIGPNLEKDTKIDRSAVEAICHLIEATKGVTTTFEDAMRYLLFHRTKAVKPMPWNADLCIGPNVKIPISAYGRIRNVKVIQPWMKAYRDPVTNTASATEGIGRKKEFYRTEDNARVDKDDIVTGYYYGQTVVPFSDADRVMLYESGSKGLQIYGFTEASNIQWQNLTGDGVSYVFGRKGDAKAQKAVLCLVSALRELNLVGVVRRVYNNGNAPTMFALFPCVDTENFYCLSLVALYYNDDIKGLIFPPTSLKTCEPSNYEVDAFKKLIGCMDLMTAYDGYDDPEAFPILETVNPSVQYILDCLAFRAVNPDQPIPPPRKDILTLFQLPELIEKQSKETLEQLKKLLNLKEVEKKPRKPRANTNALTNVFPGSTVGNQLDNPTSSFADFRIILSEDDDTVTNIGTVDPVGDFRVLQKAGKSLDYLSVELTAVIENLVYLNFDDDYTKAIDTMKVFREESVKGEPSKYNNWLKDFKAKLAERGKGNVLQILKNENLNSITKEENDRSCITKEELEGENPMYEVNTVPDSTELTIQSDIYDIFDEM